jgi:hypothetical protein
MQALVGRHDFRQRQLQQLGIGAQITAHESRRRQSVLSILFEGLDDLGTQMHGSRHAIDVQPQPLTLSAQQGARTCGAPGRRGRHIDRLAPFDFFLFI